MATFGIDLITGKEHLFTFSGLKGDTGASGVTTIIYSGLTVFTGVTPTVVNSWYSGNTQYVSIYVPSGATGAQGASGATGASGLTVVNYYTFLPSGGTKIGVGTGNTITIYSPTGGTSSFTGYTFVESGGTKINVSGNIVTIYSTVPTGTTVSWNDITNKPNLVLTSVFTGYTATTDTRIIGIENNLNNLNGSDIYLSGTTDITLQDLLNYTYSAGRLTIEADIADNGDGTVSVGAGTGIIKTEIPVSTGNTARELVNWGNIVYVTWTGLTSLALTDNAYNYIYYKGSTGQILATTNINDISYYEDFTLGRVVRMGTDITIRICGMNLWNFQRRVQMFGEEVFSVIRAKGLNVGETAGLTFTVTEGVVWAELVNRFTVSAKLSGDTFTYWYNTTGTWTQITGQTQINNTQYNNIATGLVTLTNNRYGVHWVYAVHDGSYHVVYGEGDYLLPEAQNAQPPANLPVLLSSYGTLCAKIIIEKNATSFTEIESAFAKAFVPATVTQHNDLGGIQGGLADDYQHLTTAQLGYVNSVSGLTLNFQSHTGDTSIHYPQSAITITTSQITDLKNLIQLIDISGNTDVNTISGVSINWTTQEISGSSFMFTGGSRIGINETGLYTISYVLNVYNQSGGTKNVGTVIRKNGNTDITPTSSTSHVINIENKYGTNSMPPYKVTLSNTDYIELIGFRIGDSGVVLTKPNGSWITLIK